jgi:hypothetical protein
MAAVAILPAYGIQSYGDLGFQSLTSCLILGVAIGVAGKVSTWAADRQATVRRLKTRGGHLGEGGVKPTVGHDG